MSRFETLSDLQRWCSEAPAGTRLDASELAAVLEDVADAEPVERREPEPAEPAESTWRTKLWTCPAETRLGLKELAEALDVSDGWIYSRTKQDAEPRLPHGKMGGSLVFRAGEIRAWLRDHEEDVVAYRMEPAAGELRVEGGRAS